LLLLCGEYVFARALVLAEAISNLIRRLLAALAYSASVVVLLLAIKYKLSIDECVD
jgi:hypothetical protein